MWGLELSSLARPDRLLNNQGPSRNPDGLDFKIICLDVLAKQILESPRGLKVFFFFFYKRSCHNKKVADCASTHEF